MFILSIIMMMIMIISMTIMMMTSILSKKMIEDREKSSPFECGFDPKSSARTPFSLRFFLIAVMFLIFDVEIALLLPVMIIMHKSKLKIWSMTSFMFLSLLLLGLYHEWNQGSLEWAL
uniref:NADH dehydrogenase subunit 3 n=1 Tax=Allacta hainanensis TaxID=3037030 RepID=UPI0027A63ED7|nr:NADH dehydrogenase subunit 3 [Allacta hainanensis]WGO56995.1 NADH dehydrogenase subunit 3 [Allacta hainanensis]